MILIQTVVPDYRVPVFREIHRLIPDAFKVLSGHGHFTIGIDNQGIGEPWHTEVQNYFFFKRKLCWQRGICRFCLNPDVIVIEANPRVLSTFFLVLLRRLFRKPTVVWGHVYSTQGAASFSNRFRHLFFKLADKVLCYTYSQAKELTSIKGFNASDVSFAPNSVLSQADCQESEFNERAGNVLYVGRLIPAKRPQLLIRGFRQALSKLNPETRLEIVGDGPELLPCRQLVKELGIEGRVDFHGHVSEIPNLRKIHSRALFTVAAGYVGLSVIHSLGFGVPVLIADVEVHSPEIEACKSGDNCVFFEARNIIALADGIIDFFEAKELWLSRRADLSLFIRKNYTVEKMASQIVEVANSTKPTK